MSPVFEHPLHPFFPQDAFSIVPAQLLTYPQLDCRFASDVIGCLVSITDHVAASDGHLAFTIVIDDPGFVNPIYLVCCFINVLQHRCFCLSIKYTHFVPPAGFDLHHIASAEAVRPILCILTAVVPRMSIGTYAFRSNLSYAHS
ncbi:hypothetical protein LINGRAPRIM_LOCUS609 [Linum grandiflorum]